MKDMSANVDLFINNHEGTKLSRDSCMVLDRGYRLLNMIIVSTFSSRGREETLIEFPVYENSKFLPRASLSKSSSELKSSYIGGLVNIGRLMCRIPAR